MTIHSTRIKVGTRPSPLAIIQADHVISHLSHHYPTYTFERCEIASQGDIDRTTPISEIGGKGVFIKTLELALLHGDIDIAVHSLKDVTTTLESGLIMAAVLSPESRLDCAVTKNNVPLAELSPGAIIGTGSLRRIALINKIFPTLTTTPIRGNVATRLAMVTDGTIDGVILSEAGLIRLGLADKITESLSAETFLPAPGQGVVSLECRFADPLITDMCKAINDTYQFPLSDCEIEFVSGFGFDCSDPIAAYASYTDETSDSDIDLKVFIGSVTGSTELVETCRFPRQGYAAMVKLWVQVLKRKLS